MGDNDIQGHRRSLRELLSNKRFTIDYYQREYKWGPKQVAELIADLTDKFKLSFRDGDPRSETKNYPGYFLGTVIMSEKGSEVFVVDGQQRLTTMSLLLIFLRRLQIANGDATDPNLEPMILSKSYGESNFNMNVPERHSVIDALFKGEEPPETDEGTSNNNIVQRFRDLEDAFPDEFAGERLPYFLDWLIERVVVVEITAYSDDDAYTIFETMNDRGLPLIPADMLKGYLLSNIRDDSARSRADKIWKDSVQPMALLGRDAENDFFRSWFRGTFAQSVGTTSDDYEKLGPEFHRWIRDRHEQVGLLHSDDFSTLVLTDLPFRASVFMELRKAISEYDRQKFPNVFMNAETESSNDQFMLIMAALQSSDSPPQVIAKIQIVSMYVDIFLNRRIWNYKNVGKQSLKGSMLPIARSLRGCSVDEVAAKLYSELTKEGHDTFEGATPALVSAARKRIHRLLARITDYVEEYVGDRGSRFDELVISTGRNKYDIEHILPNKFELSVSDFDTPEEFDEWRNKLGALGLLLHSTNASYQDKPWAEKVPLYARTGHTILLASLAPVSYTNNPRLNRMRDDLGIDFLVLDPETGSFGKSEIEKRGAVMRSIANQIWNPDKILEIEGVDGLEVQRILENAAD